MSRALALVFAVLLAHTAVSIAIAPGQICPEQCPADDADGRCPPVCLSCAPAAHAAAPLITPLFLAPVPLRTALLPPAARAPSEPDPGDIFHVPKSLLA